MWQNNGEYQKSPKNPYPTVKAAGALYSIFQVKQKLKFLDSYLFVNVLLSQNT
jgi:hypothetical protein